MLALEVFVGGFHRGLNGAFEEFAQEMRATAGAISLEIDQDLPMPAGFAVFQNHYPVCGVSIECTAEASTGLGRFIGEQLRQSVLKEAIGILLPLCESLPVVHAHESQSGPTILEQMQGMATAGHGAFLVSPWSEVPSDVVDRVPVVRVDSEDLWDMAGEEICASLVWARPGAVRIHIINRGLTSVQIENGSRLKAEFNGLFDIGIGVLGYSWKGHSQTKEQLRDVANWSQDPEIGVEPGIVANVVLA